MELWSYAQRDERLRERLALGVGAMRATFARFAATSALDAGVESSPQASEQFANVMIALGVGLPMLKLIDPDAVPAPLLGAVLSVLIKAAESSEEAREVLAAARSGNGATVGREH